MARVLRALSNPPIRMARMLSGEEVKDRRKDGISLDAADKMLTARAAQVSIVKLEYDVLARRLDQNERIS